MEFLQNHQIRTLQRQQQRRRHGSNGSTFRFSSSLSSCFVLVLLVVSILLLLLNLTGHVIMMIQFMEQEEESPTTSTRDVLHPFYRHHPTTTRTTTTRTSTTMQSSSTTTSSSSSDGSIRSTKDSTFFRTLQNQIDHDNDTLRCLRYGWSYKDDGVRRQRRRIFLGSLIANEPRELLEIIAAETYGIYSGIVLVESNRTPSFIPRSFHYYTSNQKQEETTKNSTTTTTTPIQRELAQLFGLSSPSQLQIRSYINEDATLIELEREQDQRNREIIRGWKQLGMTVDDIGIVADMDETFTRDVLRAVQVCDNIPQLDYTTHKCRHDRVKLRATSRIYETSPECIVKYRRWYHPDMIVGHCIEGIANATLHPPAPRLLLSSLNEDENSDEKNPNDNENQNHNAATTTTTKQQQQPRSFLRAVGFGHHCTDWDGEKLNITNHHYPSWSAADFRRTCSGKQLRTNPDTNTNSTQQQPRRSRNDIIGGTIDPEDDDGDMNTHHRTTTTTSRQEQLQLYHSIDTAYHFHNFFTSVNDIRFKYRTYAHSNTNATLMAFPDLSLDLNFVYHCMYPKSIRNGNNTTTVPVQRQYQRVKGGFRNLLPFVPIYFQDEDYRGRRHLHVKTMIEMDHHAQQQQQQQRQQQESSSTS